MGQAGALDEQVSNLRPKPSALGLLLKAAESGWLPDALIRVGIRRLLKSRLRDLQVTDREVAMCDFLRATQSQPIAVVPEKANEQHYEVPAEFFRHVLGTHLKYSCCYWSEDTDSLEKAEANALQITCKNASIENGMDILELGCGWGSLSLWMASKYPDSRIVSVSNSNSQREFIERQARERGLSNLTVVTADMNDFHTSDSFDRVVSVEMFEHMRNHRRLMQRISSWLSPGGQLFVHVFCHKDSPYLFRSDGEQNWMGRYFFSGGMMPSEDMLPRCSSPLELVSKVAWNGHHYAKTCRAWLRHQDAAKDSLISVLTDTYGPNEATRWFYRWRLFFMACEELFAYHGGEEWFVSHYQFRRCTNN